MWVHQGGGCQVLGEPEIKGYPCDDHYEREGPSPREQLYLATTRDAHIKMPDVAPNLKYLLNLPGVKLVRVNVPSQMNELPRSIWKMATWDRVPTKCGHASEYPYNPWPCKSIYRNSLDNSVVEFWTTTEAHKILPESVFDPYKIYSYKGVHRRPGPNPFRSLGELAGAVKVCVAYKRSKVGAPLRCSQWSEGPGYHPGPHSITAYAIQDVREAAGLKRKYRYRTSPPLPYPPREAVSKGKRVRNPPQIARKGIIHIRLLGTAKPVRKS